MLRNKDLRQIRQPSRLLASLAVAFVLANPVAAQQQAPQQPMSQAVMTPPARVFGSETGLMLNFVKADKTSDFEAVMEKVKEALTKSSNPLRRQQAASWRVYKSPDPAPAGSVLYVYIVDPVVKGADYSITPVLAEAFSGEEYAALLKQYTGAYASGQNFVNLTLVSDLGK